MDDRDRMMRRNAWIPWALTSLALVAVAIAAYNFGAHREIAGGEPARRVYYGFPGFWLFFLLFWVFGGLRRMWWGWGWCGRPYRPWRYSRYDRYRAEEDERDEWDEWHRRAHDRMEPGRRGGSASEPSTRPDRPVIT